MREYMNIELVVAMIAVCQRPFRRLVGIVAVRLRESPNFDISATLNLFCQLRYDVHEILQQFIFACTYDERQVCLSEMPQKSPESFK